MLLPARMTRTNFETRVYCADSASGRGVHQKNFLQVCHCRHACASRSCQQSSQYTFVTFAVVVASSFISAACPLSCDHHFALAAPSGKPEQQKRLRRESVHVPRASGDAVTLTTARLLPLPWSPCCAAVTLPNPVAPQTLQTFACCPALPGCWRKSTGSVLAPHPFRCPVGSGWLRPLSTVRGTRGSNSSSACSNPPAASSLQLRPTLANVLDDEVHAAPIDKRSGWSDIAAASQHSFWLWPLFFAHHLPACNGLFDNPLSWFCFRLQKPLSTVPHGLAGLPKRSKVRRQ